MGDVEVPIITVRHQNVAVRQMTVSDAVDLYVCRHRLLKRFACAIVFGAQIDYVSLQREQITLHSNQISFVTLHCSDKVTLRVVWKQLPMDDVNVFPGAEDHNFPR